jgi:hypothetical protein
VWRKTVHAFEDRIKFRCGSCGLEGKEQVGFVLPGAPASTRDPPKRGQASRMVGLRSKCGCPTGTGGATPTTRGTLYTTRYLQTVEECKIKGAMGYRMLTTQHEWENSGISWHHNAQFSVACLNCENFIRCVMKSRSPLMPRAGI